MSLVILVLLLDAVALAGVAVGINMMPLCRHNFSAMTAEERARYRRGLIIALTSLAPLLLFVLLLCLAL